MDLLLIPLMPICPESQQCKETNRKSDVLCEYSEEKEDELIPDYKNDADDCNKKSPNRPESRLGSLQKWRSHPLIHNFGFCGLGTKCWGKTLWVGTKHILPRCELLEKFRYEKEM